MSEPLKPCPFDHCAEAETVIATEVGPAGRLWHYGTCLACQARGPFGPNEARAAQFWNAAPRPAPKPPGPTARVRIPVAVTDKGVWGAYSWGFRDGALGKQAGATAEESEEIAGPNGERKHVVWVTADVPLPPEEVQGEVEA